MQIIGHSQGHGHGHGHFDGQLSRGGEVKEKFLTVGELRQILNRHDDIRDDEEISVLLALPSIGPRAHTKIKHASFGSDWDKGLQFTTETRLVPKTEKQDIYEAAYDLLFWLATKPQKKETYEVRTAKRILLKYGRTQEDLDKLRPLFHEVKP